MMLFVAVAFRYGALEHVFPIGVFSTAEAAKKAAIEYHTQRGGKYDHRIYPFELDIPAPERAMNINSEQFVEYEGEPFKEPQSKLETRDALVTFMANSIARLQRRVPDHHERKALNETHQILSAWPWPKKAKDALSTLSEYAARLNAADAKEEAARIEAFIPPSFGKIE